MICPQCGTLNANTTDSCQRCKRTLRSPEMAGKIPCENHANREATTSCGTCGVRLCAACAVGVNGIDFCDAHAPAGAARPTYDEDYERVPVVDVARAERASVATRGMALAVDALLVAAAGMVLAMLFWLLTQSLDFVSSPETQPAGYYAYRLLMGAGLAAYGIVLVAMNGQTVGKQVAGAIVLDRDGRILTLRASAVRFAVAVLSALPLGLGFWWALWDPKGETWHDKAAGTAVFRWDQGA